ncbi:unnamed protein product [Clonostachys solani]|uniref:FAD-binding PCMH-type domain-containing protein n=1 Tax=Clonostachys solani TaxID=160281 RepID=A0A9N9Z9K2_9HYPO|nr:unnamed protein product [Clonostachys solani]
MDTNQLTLALQSQVPGLEVLNKHDQALDTRCSYYNRSLNQQPLAVVRPTNQDQVSKTISFCNNKIIAIAVRSGGHDFFGRSVVDDGIVMDMRGINSVEIADDGETARVGGGIISGDLQQFLARYKLFTPTGQVKTVGYVSWACGGGYGFYVGTYGFGVDQIVGAKVATSDGQIIDTDHDDELLWALRGAGAGIVGVVVELRIKVYPAPRLYAGLLTYPLSEAAAVLDGLEQLAGQDGLPDAFSGDAIIARPEMLQLPSSVPSLIFYWCWTAIEGGLTEAVSFLDKMRHLGSVQIDTVQETAAAEFGGGESSTPVFFRSCNVSVLGADVARVLAASPPIHPLCAVVVHNNHGQGVRRGFDDGIGAVFCNRRRHIILGLHGGTAMGAGPDRGMLAESTAWVRGLLVHLSKLECHRREGFPAFSPPDDVHPADFFGVEAAQRLFQVKKRLDPGNFFSK